VTFVMGANAGRPYLLTIGECGGPGVAKVREPKRAWQ